MRRVQNLLPPLDFVVGSVTCEKNEASEKFLNFDVARSVHRNIFL